MNRNVRFSDELLNAFIDGELDSAERERILDALSRDAELSHRVCELQKVREMVQLAYDMVPGIEHTAVSEPRLPRRAAQGIAAGVILGVGIGMGWVSHAQLNPAPESPSNGLLALANAVEKAPGSVAAQDEWRVMVHVSSGGEKKLKAVLDDTEQLLAAYKRTGQKLRVEVLTNAGGLDLLRTDTAPAPQRVARLQQRYKNLRFLACSKALKRLQDERGVVADLLPGTRVVPSAADEILERQKEGWTYINI